MKKTFVVKSFHFAHPIMGSSVPPRSNSGATVGFNNMRLTGIADPINPQDAVTLGFLQTAMSDATTKLLSTLTDEVSVISQRLNTITPHAINALSLYGDVMLGNIDMNGLGIVTGLANPVSPGDAVNLAFANANYLPKSDASKDIDMGGTRTITGLKAPVEPGDAVNYATLQNTFAGISASSLKLLSISGGTLQGNLNMQGLYTITGLPTPVHPTDAVNLAYLNTYYLPLTGGTLSGNLNMQGLYTITGIPNPTHDSDAVNLATLNDSLKDISCDSLGGLSLTGGTINGNINMGGTNTVTGLLNPIHDDEAVNLSTLQSSLSSFLSKTGGLLFGNLNFASKYTITGLPDPVYPGDAVNLQTFQQSVNALSTLASQALYLTGGTMKGNIDMGNTSTTKGSSILGLPTPKQPSEVVPLSYLQNNYLPLTGGTITGALSLSSNLSVLGTTTLQGATEMRSSLSFSSVTDNDSVDFGAIVTETGAIQGGITVTGLKNPVNPTDAVNLSYLENNFFSSRGGTFSAPLHIQGDFSVSGRTTFAGNITFQNNLLFSPTDTPTVIDFGNSHNTLGAKITGVGNPLQAYDAVNLSYLNERLSSYLSVSGGSLQGNLDMNGHRVTGVITPTETSDALTLGYLNTQGIFQAYYIKYNSPSDTYIWSPNTFLPWATIDTTFVASQQADSYFALQSPLLTQVNLLKNAIYSINVNLLINTPVNPIGQISLNTSCNSVNNVLSSISPSSSSCNYSLNGLWVVSNRNTTTAPDCVSLYLNALSTYITPANVSASYWSFMAINAPF